MIQSYLDLSDEVWIVDNAIPLLEPVTLHPRNNRCSMEQHFMIKTKILSFTKQFVPGGVRKPHASSVYPLQRSPEREESIIMKRGRF